MNFDNESGSCLELTIGLAEEGEQTIKIRYTNASPAARPMEIKINETVLAESTTFGVIVLVGKHSYNIQYTEPLFGVLFIPNGSHFAIVKKKYGYFCITHNSNIIYSGTLISVQSYDNFLPAVCLQNMYLISSTMKIKKVPNIEHL